MLARISYLSDDIEGGMFDGIIIFSVKGGGGGLNIAKCVVYFIANSLCVLARIKW